MQKFSPLKSLMDALGSMVLIFVVVTLLYIIVYWPYELYCFNLLLVRYYYLPLLLLPMNYLTTFLVKTFLYTLKLTTPAFFLLFSTEGRIMAGFKNINVLFLANSIIGSIEELPTKDLNILKQIIPSRIDMILATRSEQAITERLKTKED